MKQVCVLGNGQLGRMLRQAGEPLGIAVWPVGLDAEPAAVPFQQSVITAEIERWPETALSSATLPAGPLTMKSWSTFLRSTVPRLRVTLRSAGFLTPLGRRTQIRFRR